LSPYYIYEFFALNLKFVSAAIFFEIHNQKQKLINNNINSNVECYIINKIYVSLPLTIFKEYKYFFPYKIVEYMIYLRRVCNKKTRAWLNDRFSGQLIYGFIHIGVLFNFDTIYTPPIHGTTYNDYLNQQVFKINKLIFLLSSVTAFYTELKNLIIDN